MNCIIKSWRCEKCQREEYFMKPKDKHFSDGKGCDGKWIEYNWNRCTKPILEV
jgi:hypothetical protein